MTSEHWQKIKPLLDAALQRGCTERGAFLDEACKDDPVLRGDLQKLINAHELTGDYIEVPGLEEIESLAGSTSDAVGQSLGNYRLLGQLGVGGMGEVYLAEDSRLGRKVALKMLASYFTTEEDRVRRFQLEARAASALNHPNILTIYEMGQIDSRHFIATEFVEGETLRERNLRSKLSISEVLEVAIQIAAALGTAHHAGIVHRDIKPDNVMLRPDGLVKVLDFGIAKLTEPATGPEAWTLLATRQGLVMGTVQYMSPEQARGLEMDPRSDVFSLGVVLYEMLAGGVPFPGETSADILASILMVEPPALTEATPPELRSIVQKALHKQKDERYQTAEELLIDLRSLRDDLKFATRQGRPSHSHQASQTG
jgi:serine/threonine protein kinase